MGRAEPTGSAPRPEETSAWSCRWCWQGPCCDAQSRAPSPPVSFRGAPAQRFREFEDARIDDGLLPAGPGDLQQLLLSDFATNCGNYWYVIPIDLAVGTLTRTRSLVIGDPFGVQTLIQPNNADGTGAFSMYALSTLQRSPAPDTSSATVFQPAVPVPVGREGSSGLRYDGIEP